MSREAENKNTNIPPQMGPPGRRGGPGAMGMPVVKAKNAKGTLKRLWSYIGHQRLPLTIVGIMVIIGTFANVFSTMMIGTAIDKYIANRNFSGLAWYSLLIMAVYLIGACASWLQMRVMMTLAQNTIREVRRDLFYTVQTLPVGYFDARTHGELMSRLANDIDTVGQTLNQSLIQLISSLLTVLATFGAMLFISPVLSIIPLVVIPLSMFMAKFFAKRSRKYFSMQQKDLGQLNSIIEETISGQKVVKVFGREKRILEDFRRKNDELRTSGYKAQIFSGFIMPVMNSLNNLAYASIALIGGFMYIKGYTALTIGGISNMLTYSKQFSRPINELASLFNLIQSAIASAERVFEVMDADPEPSEGKLLDKTRVKGEVEFKNVTFAYKENENVLKNVSINAKPGALIALVGPTGAGKTTIVNLLTRFYDVGEGEIILDGDDIRDINRSSLRGCLGMVIQETYLFSATIRENIRYGRLDATNEEVEQAARLANVHRFISNLPNGYDTVLSDAGEGISQGQRQLIAIARVMLANPQILILDEATSSIDTRTEKHIQQALLTLMYGRTSFVIAHRLSTIRDADEILVINDGEITERGNHEALYAMKGFYYNLYTSQFKREA